MRTAKLPLQSFRLRNFKAVRDSGVIQFTPLTAFIGNNGSGKSSVIEALEALQAMVLHGIDDAMEPWRLFEDVRNKAVPHELEEDATGHERAANPMTFEVDGDIESGLFHARLDVNVDSPEHPDRVVFQAYDPAADVPPDRLFSPTRMDDRRFREFVAGWQFLSLSPSGMMYPETQKRSAEETRLDRSGRNLGEYVMSIQDTNVWNGILDTLRLVLPYASDLRASITSEVDRKAYLKMTEAEFTLPGWLLCPCPGTGRFVTGGR